MHFCNPALSTIIAINNQHADDDDDDDDHGDAGLHHHRSAVHPSRLVVVEVESLKLTLDVSRYFERQMTRFLGNYYDCTST